MAATQMLTSSAHIKTAVTASLHNKNKNKNKERRPHNIPDHTCIDCDTCRWMAPDIFKRVDSMSAVLKQPSSEDERLEALQGVYHCGYHSDKSYGAASYLVIHPQGNILIDSPRYSERLARNIDKLGGVHYMFLTHKDDIADHDKWSKRFGCKRIIHSKEIDEGTVDVEIKLKGSGPWNLSHDIDLIHTPGHTEGSVCLFYKSLKILFTGDHLSMSEFGLSIGEKYNFYSVPVQLYSVKLLTELDFEWISPGHGRRAEYRDVGDKNYAIESFLAAMYPA